MLIITCRSTISSFFPIESISSLLDMYIIVSRSCVTKQISCHCILDYDDDYFFLSFSFNCTRLYRNVEVTNPKSVACMLPVDYINVSRNKNERKRICLFLKDNILSVFDFIESSNEKSNHRLKLHCEIFSFLK